MAGRYKPYPEYKDSEGAWFGNTPSHWNNTSLKRVCSLKTGLTPPTDDRDNYADEITGLPWVRPEDLNDSSDSVIASKFISLSGWRLMRPVPANSTLICCIGTIGKVGYTACETTTNQQITAACFNESFRYNYYLIQAAREVLEEYSTGNVIKILNSERLGSIRFISLPEVEAGKIADFLDHETAKIDTLIETQQQLIQLLKEKRQAEISHAVTKGLSSLNGGPNAKLRDSGVEWLGEVPEDWTVCLIKHMCEEVTDGAHISPVTEGGERHFVSTTDIKNGVINFDDALLTTPASFEYMIKTGCMPFAGDILFSKDGTIGQTAITPEGVEFVVASSLIIIRPNKEVVMPDYFNFLLQSEVVVEQVKSFVKGAGLPRLSIQNLLKVGGAFPPVSEQVQIVAYLTRKLERYDELETRASIIVKLLQERRIALISAAVTGKIDVRDWVAPPASPTHKEVAA
ncbi:hypothetical protein PS645_02296 [Pseudomonas fluorescens]|uniref:Type I restriction modification DNA specificity domain-containing protein n=1 Tax=Pseudomonas fluorescens TaxID=294 RepID=A0A5E6SKM6_PSEFL|nr:restriction endonuclease subunit S [Pseudomonas fluorescens]VVM81544.1 hypothetical protein PS645_02296 [Pseudomonas fluorescens]